MKYRAALAILLTTSLSLPLAAQDPSPEAETTEAEAGPDINEIYRTAVSRYERGGITAAFRGFREVAVLDPTFSEAVYNVGVIAASTDRLSDCSLFNRSFLALRPDDSDVAAVLRRAEVCERSLDAKGTLSITLVSPENTTFFVDGLFFGQSTIEAMPIPAGTHTITASRLDHDPFETTVVIADGEAAETAIILTPVTYHGTVMLNVSQPGAEILIDNVPHTIAPMGEPVRLPVGRYLFSVRADGFHPWNRYVEVSRDLDDVIDIRLLDESIDLNDL
jgi:hypothetical protein